MMMNRLVLALAVTLLFSFAAVEVKGAKCAKPTVKTTSQLTLFPPQASSSGQFSFPGNPNGNCNSGPNGNGNAGNCNGNGNGNANGNSNSVIVSSACNCTKGQAVYNLIGSTNTSTTGTPHVLVACNNTKQFCMKGSNGKKYKLKKAENLISPQVAIFSVINSKGKAQNLAVLNCPTVSTGGNSSSSVTFNKKAGFNKKWNCKKQVGKLGDKAAPAFGTKKGKKYIKVKAISCSGCKQLKTCKV